MNLNKKIVLLGAGLGTGLMATPALAGELSVNIQVPRLNVAEYHKPYVAMWLEDGTGKVAANLSVWYDDDMRGGEGTKWLADLRTWWRRAGRSMTLPVDGLTGPTKGPGRHNLSFHEGSRPMPRLAPGTYKLVIEAVREVGGREVIRMPVQWPPTKAKSSQAQGKSELGAITLTVKP